MSYLYKSIEQGDIPRRLYNSYKKKPKLYYPMKGSQKYIRLIHGLLPYHYKNKLAKQ
jgi:hypothetical protein